MPSLNGAVSLPVETRRAVLPRCHFAALMLQLVLLSPLDAAQAACVVDDFGLQRLGRESDVADELVGLLYAAVRAQTSSHACRAEEV